MPDFSFTTFSSNQKANITQRPTFLIVTSTLRTQLMRVRALAGRMCAANSASAFSLCFEFFPYQRMETSECMENFQAANGKFQYMYGKFKCMEKKPYIRMEYLRLFLTVRLCA